MPDCAMPLLNQSPMNWQQRSQWVRLRTLILLRWLAIFGQVAAVAVADQVFGIRFDLGLVYLVIASAVVANLLAMLAAPESKRLSETEAMITLLFDITQLALLLYLTGGTSNPFSLLILAPVSISATALQLRTTLVLGAVAIALVTLLTLFHQPMTMPDGTLLELPPLFGFGFWLALVIGIVFLGLYSHRVATEIHTMAEAVLAMQMALAREQKLSDLAGVVAAAAHELGTPLATIKLVSSELAEELAEQPHLREDLALVQSQVDRCRDILRSMGRAGKEDLHLRQAPVSAVVREAAEPHLQRGKTVHFSFEPGPGGDSRQPSIRRLPELVHGLRNLVQNAVDFAATSVWVDVRWSGETLTMRVLDDGPGFPPNLLGRIGDPFVRPRRAAPDRDAPEPATGGSERPGYEGMGLGLFIAKTLLERTGADISFANAADAGNGSGQGARRGAIVEIVIPLAGIEVDPDAALGENRLIRA